MGSAALMDKATICGWLFVAGLVVFMVGAVLWRPAAFQAPVLADMLRNVALHHKSWTWIHAWMTLGTALTVSALAVWEQLQRGSGDEVFTPMASQLYLLGVTLWFVAIASRMTIQTWAASEVAGGGAVPTLYPALHTFMGLLHGGHMLLSYVAASLLGLGVLRSGVLSGAIAWTGIAGGAGLAVGLVVMRGGPFGMPFLAHVYPCVLGVALLRAR